MSIFDAITGLIKDAKAKHATRRQIQNAARKSNKWNLRPFAPTLSLKELDDVARLTSHVQGLMEQVATNPPQPIVAEPIAEALDAQFLHPLNTDYPRIVTFEQQERQDEVDFYEAHPVPHVDFSSLEALGRFPTFEQQDAAYAAHFPANDQPPPNGYDYTKDEPWKAVKPAGSNAWPWNRKLACCALNEKHCQCGKWRRYF